MQSTVNVVAECVLRTVGPAYVHRVTIVEVVIDLRGEVVLAFRLWRHETETSDIQTIADVEVVWQRREADDERRGRIQSEAAEFARTLYEPMLKPGSGLPFASTDGLDLRRIAINAVHDVTIDAVARLLRVNRAVHEEGLARAQELDVRKEEGLVLAVVKCWTTFAEARQINRAADRTTEDVLYKLRSLRAIDDVVVLVRVKARRLIELEERSVKIVEPDFVTSVTCAPLLRPRSAVKLPVTT